LSRVKGTGEERKEDGTAPKDGKGKREGPEIADFMEGLLQLYLGNRERIRIRWIRRRRSMQVTRGKKLKAKGETREEIPKKPIVGRPGWVHKKCRDH